MGRTKSADLDNVHQQVLGRYGGINEDFVLVDGWGECEAEGSQEMVEGVGKALV